MSRSYKKTPICVFTDTYEKQQSNRQIRRTNDLCNGSMYKKVHRTWYMKEFYGMHTFNEYKNKSYNWEELRRTYNNGKISYNYYTLTEKELYKKWYKWYQMK